MSVVLRPNSIAGTRDFVLREVAIPGVGGGSGGVTATPVDGVLPATPVLYGGFTAGGQGQIFETAFRWVELGYVMDEGGTITISAQLSQGVLLPVYLPIIVEATSGANTGVPGDLIVTPTDSSVGGIGPYVFFPPGSTFATVRLDAGQITPAVGETFRELQIRAAITGGPEVPPGLFNSNGVNISPNPSFGSIITTIRINDVTSPPVVPRWTWTGVQATGTPAVPEGFGDLNVPITLDQPALTDTFFDITITPGTAVAGTHYELVTPTIFIQKGTTLERVKIRILSSALLVPNITQCTVNAVAQDPAHALPATGGVSSWELSIQEAGSPTTFVEMAAAAVQALEDGLPVTILGQTSGQQQPTQTYEIDVLVTEIGAMAGTDYVLTWHHAPNKALVPIGGGAFPIVTITAFDEGGPPDIGEQVVFELDASTAPSGIVIAGQLTTTATIIDLSQPGFTEAAVMLQTTLASNMIQGLVAVNPPSATLPVFMVDGVRAQTVGMDRDGDGLWISAYVYAIVARDTVSAPFDVAAAIQLDLADGSETSVAGAFGTEQLVTYRMRPANTGSDYERECNGDAFGPSLTANQITGPDHDIGWDQVGDDLVRETRNSCWLADTGVALGTDLAVRSGSQSPDTRCCMVDAVTTLIKGLDIQIVSGSFHNGATDFNEDVSNLGYETRTSGGNCNFRWFEAEIPAGWTPVVADAHPNVVIAGQVIRFVMDRADLDPSDPAYDCDHIFPTCAEYQFRFAMIKTVGGNVDATAATRILQRRCIATWVGRYGVEQNAIFGDWRNYQLDLHAAAIQFQGVTGATGQSGWRRAIQATTFIDGSAVGSPGVVNTWTNGEVEFPVGFETRRLPNDPAAERSSWAHPWSTPGLDAPGGPHVNGSQGQIPCAGWWRAADLQRMGLANRLRLKMQSPYSPGTGNGWWWQIAIQGGGQGRAMPWQTAAETDPSLFRMPWHFTNECQAVIGGEANVLNNSTFVPADSVYVRAPYTGGASERPWNAFEVQQDPSHADLVGGQDAHGTPAMTHTSRMRDPAIDGWWGCREHMARSILEQLGAFASRIYAPCPMARENGNTGGAVQRLIKPFHHLVRSFGDIALHMTGPNRQAKLNLGTGFLPGSGVIPNVTYGNLRCEAWALNHVLTFFNTGTDEQRAHINGDSSLSGGFSFFDAFAAVINRLMTDTGLTGRVYQNVTNGNPYSPINHDRTELSDRTGAWPDGVGDSTNVTYEGPNRVTGQIQFHHWFFLRTLASLRRARPAGSALSTLLDRIFDTPINILAGARSYSVTLGVPFQRGADIWNKFVCFNIEGGGNPATEHPLDPPVATVAQMRAGAVHWRLRHGPPPDGISGADQLEKILPALFDVFRITGNPIALNIAGEVYEQPNWPRNIVSPTGVVDPVKLNQMFTALLRQPGSGWENFHGHGNSIHQRYNGFFSWWTPFMAWIQRLGAQPL